MPMSREEWLEMVRKIAGENPDDEKFDMVERLTDDFDARNGFVEYTMEQVYDTDGREWREKYGELKERYRTRFWNGPQEERGDRPEERGEIEIEAAVDTVDEYRVEDLFEED